MQFWGMRDRTTQKLYRIGSRSQIWIDEWMEWYWIGYIVSRNLSWNAKYWRALPSVLHWKNARNGPPAQRDINMNEASWRRGRTFIKAITSPGQYITYLRLAPMVLEKIRLNLASLASERATIRRTSLPPGRPCPWLHDSWNFLQPTQCHKSRIFCILFRLELVDNATLCKKSESSLPILLRRKEQAAPADTSKNGSK
jgi:hypothetical protein